MGVAVAGGNIITLIFTVVFARLLGTASYGSLATLTSAFFIASIPGTALQVTVAREVAAAAVTRDERALASNVHGWTRMVAGATILLTVLSVLLRAPLADVFGVSQRWAAALVLPSGGLWALVSLQRGALQGLQSYYAVGVSVVGEAVGRLLLGLGLLGVGFDVTGAFGGEAASLVVWALVLRRLLRARERAFGVPALSRATRRPLRSVLSRAGPPVVAMGLLALLQNLDVIVVKHTASAHAAGTYASASLSAKALVWLAVGLGMYLLPEASRRFHQGEDTRRLFFATVGIMALVAAPALVTFGLFGHELLELVFGRTFASGADELLPLGGAMTALAFTYLSAQYLIALRRSRFLWLLAATALAEPLVLAVFGGRLVDVAGALLALQLVLAAALVALDLYRPRRVSATPAADIADTSAPSASAATAMPPEDAAASRDVLVRPRRW
jgi:O-antigen/teichoic acid export membrane protein